MRLMIYFYFFLFSSRRREPHNYDKSQPTTNQTLMYNQILAQTQQQSQPQIPQQHNQNIFHNTNYSETSAINVSPIQTTTNNFVQNLSNQNVLNLSNNTSQMHSINTKYLNSNIQNLSLMSSGAPNNLISNVPNLIPILSINSQQSTNLGNIQHSDSQPQQQNDMFKALSSHQINTSQNESHKPYHNPHNSKISQTSGTFKTSKIFHRKLMIRSEFSLSK